MVRHQVLVLAFGGSNPSIPAMKKRLASAGLFFFVGHSDLSARIAREVNVIRGSVRRAALAGASSEKARTEKNEVRYPFIPAKILVKNHLYKRGGFCSSDCYTRSVWSNFSQAAKAYAKIKSNYGSTTATRGR